MTFKKKTMLSAAMLVLTCAFATPAMAQDDKMAPMAIPSQPDAIVLGTGALPGATAPEAWHRQYGSVFARNVTVATLTPSCRPKARAPARP
jgi:hypothetical protein